MEFTIHQNPDPDRARVKYNKYDYSGFSIARVDQF